MANDSGERRRRACRALRPREALSLSLCQTLFGEAPKSAREGACALQNKTQRSQVTGQNSDKTRHRELLSLLRASPLRDCNFAPLRCRRRRNDPFGFRGGVLSSKFFHIKQKEHAGHDQERTDPFQEPAGIAQNLNRALPEVLRIPRRLRHFECLAAPGSPPIARKTEGMIHPALTGGAIALGGRDSHCALESSGRIVAFIARDLEIQQFECDWQWDRTPTVRNANWIW